ncbi:DUF1828 domain-containing protein [Agrilactobacillus fermenti]|uniref:DUF1828 domain-containing protein n=1 Tax=Agrilactobacillus fermenti TaxID=2586909 RepID=UPI003A5C0C4F
MKTVTNRRNSLGRLQHEYQKVDPQMFAFDVDTAICTLRSHQTIYLSLSGRRASLTDAGYTLSSFEYSMFDETQKQLLTEVLNQTGVEMDPDYEFHKDTQLDEIDQELENMAIVIRMVKQIQYHNDH